MKNISIGLIVFWTTVIFFPKLIAYLIWWFFVFIGISVLSLKAKFWNKKESRGDYVKFWDYKIFRGKK